MNSGNFRLLLFNHHTTLDDYNFNNFFKIDCSTKPIDNLNYPFITATFLDLKNIFISLYHSKSNTMYNCKFSPTSSRNTEKSKTSYELPEHSTRNFPISVHFHKYQQCVWIFYRNGMAFR